MSKTISDVTEGFIEILEEISHDPEEFDVYDLKEYIENAPNPAKILYEFALYVHQEFL
jgi:hypothetical protein